VNELPDRVRAAVAAYRAKVAGRFGGRMREIRLFGSYARGEARPDSDVDVLVVVDGLTREEWREASGMAYDVLLDSGVCISSLTCSLAEWQTLRARERRIALDIEREGIPL
jgi:predicted nucleotidyltransferase